LHNWCREIRAGFDWDFGPLEVKILFLSKNTIESAARAFTNFLVGERRR
jgi:hypothetical protein